MISTDRLTKVVVYEREYAGNTQDPPKSLAEFCTWLNDIVAQIPVEYHHAARIEFDTEYQYGDPWWSLQISYLRPETPEETRVREEAARRKAEFQKTSRRSLYEQLKKEFGE